MCIFEPILWYNSTLLMVNLSVPTLNKRVNGSYVYIENQYNAQLFCPFFRKKTWPLWSVSSVAFVIWFWAMLAIVKTTTKKYLQKICKSSQMLWFIKRFKQQSEKNTAYINFNINCNEIFWPWVLDIHHSPTPQNFIGNA